MKPYNNSEYNTGNREYTSQINFDYRKIIIETVRYWWLFLVVIGISLSFVTIKHRYAKPIYSASMSILIENIGSEKPQSDMMEGFGLSTAMRGLENQMAILSSWSTIRQAVGNLNYEVSYFKTGRVINSELYKNSPFTVHFNAAMPQLSSVNIYITLIDKETYKLSYECENGTTYSFQENKTGPNINSVNHNEIHKFGTWIDIPGLQIMIENRTLTSKEEKGYYFVFNNLDLLASKFQSGFRSYKTGENTSIVRLNITGENSTKNIEFLNELSSVFIQNNLDKKNQIATNTIRFIEEQLELISDSLSEKGTELSLFRTMNQIQSVSSQAEIYYSKLDNIASLQSQLQLEKNYYNYLSNYFENDTIFNQTLAPANYKIENPAVKEQVNTLIQLSIEYQTLKQNKEEAFNPYIVDLQAKMEVSRQTLLKAIDNQVSMIDNEINRMQEEEKLTTNKLYQLPEKERQLFGIERQYSLNNEVYTFLLRKRSEAQIQKASNTPDHSVLQSARYSGQVYPIKGNDRKKALLIGVIIPFLFIIAKHILNNKISGADEVEKITNLSLIGNILHNTKEESKVVLAHPKSVISEAFRRIRTRLEYLSSSKDETPVYAISSSMPGEGKTFSALNIASVFAISGKKTALLGFDLRKPRLNKILDLPKLKGISEYLTNQIELSEIIHQVEENSNLYYISSGEIPPNPSELIASSQTKEFFDKLKEEFDIIIIDTPPMGIVSDAYLLARYADSIVFVTRQNYTVKSVLFNTIKQMQQEGISNIGVILNDIPQRKGLLGYSYYYGSKYGYAYSSYGRGYGYYEE